MLQYKSIKGKEICFNRDTQYHTIYDILKKRFTDEDLSESSLSKLLDPYLMKDMKSMVDRIEVAIQKKQKVMVFGDYDVDGVTSTALIVHILHTLKIPVSYRIPHRINDGYGLKSYFVDEMLAL